MRRHAAASQGLLTAALSATLVMVGAGCGRDENGTDTARRPVPASSSPTTSTGEDTGYNNRAKEENGMRIQITIGEQRFAATLTESAAARDLLAQLPVTVDMVDHGQVEKTGRLPSPLSLEGQPDGADPGGG